MAYEEAVDRRDNFRATTDLHEEIYYSYYFLLSAFRNPKVGLQKIDRISYNLELLTSLLFKLDAAIEDIPSLWVINTNYFFKGFFKGLLLIGVARVVSSSDGGENTINKHSKSIEHNLEVIKGKLKEKKAQNRDLLESIARLEPIIKAATKKS